MSLSFDPELDPPSRRPFHRRGTDLGRGCDRHAPPLGRQSYAACPIAGDRHRRPCGGERQGGLKDSNWGGVRPRERTRALQAWADLIEAEAETLARLEACARPAPSASSSRGDIAITAEQIRFFAEFADKEGSDLVPTDDASLGMIMSEPYGVVGAITPWNFPLSMAGWKLGPALAAGNAVVLKPSEMTPFSTLYMAELAVRRGPAGRADQRRARGRSRRPARRSPAIPTSPRSPSPDRPRAGTAIMENVARSGIKPMTLELGGKSPQLVFADADLDRQPPRPWRSGILRMPARPASPVRA